MPTLPLFENALLGRLLPRGQRWNDVPGDDEGRDDPGFTRASYLAWERGDEELDWEDDGLEPEWEIVAQAEPEPDIVVWVNGLPLEEYLALHDAYLPSEEFDAILLSLRERLAGQHVPETQHVEGDGHADRRERARLWLFRREQDELGWGTTPRGRRWNSRSRYGYHAHHRSARVKQATRAMRTVRLPNPDGKEVM